MGGATCPRLCAVATATAHTRSDNLSARPINFAGWSAASISEENGDWAMGSGAWNVRRVWGWLLAALVLLVFAPAKALAAGTIAVDEAFASANISDHADVFIAPKGTDPQGIAAIRALPFAPSTGLNLGFREEVVWLRVPIDVRLARPEPLFLIFHYTNLDDLSLFLEQPDGSVFEQFSGDRRALSDRPVKSHELGFRFFPQPGRSTAYIRVKSESSLRLRSTLFTGASYVEAEAHERTIL